MNAFSVLSKENKRKENDIFRAAKPGEKAFLEWRRGRLRVLWAGWKIIDEKVHPQKQIPQKTQKSIDRISLPHLHVKVWRGKQQRWGIGESKKAIKIEKKYPQH